MDASEIDAQRLNAKQVLTPMKMQNLCSQSQDGTVKTPGGDRSLRPSTLIRDLPERGFGAAGLHTTTRELQTCTFQGPGALNTTKIPREDPKRGKKERKKLVAREENRKILGFHPSGHHVLGSTLSLSGPRPPPTRTGPPPVLKKLKYGQQLGLAKVG